MRSDRQKNYQYYNQCNVIFPNWEKRSELPAEGAVLEGGEERVQLRQRRAVCRLQLLHRRDTVGEFALQLDRGDLQLQFTNICQADVSSCCIDPVPKQRPLSKLRQKKRRPADCHDDPIAKCHQSI